MAEGLLAGLNLRSKFEGRLLTPRSKVEDLLVGGPGPVRWPGTSLSLLGD